MRGWHVALVVSVALLAATWWFVRDDDTSPPLGHPPSVMQAPTAVRSGSPSEPVARTPTLPNPSPSVVPPSVPSIDPAALERHDAGAAVVAMEPIAADDPYLGDSSELDYADKLAAEMDATTERLESARGVYQRCLEAHPNLARCADGLYRVRFRLEPYGGANKSFDRSVRPFKNLQLDR